MSAAACHGSMACSRLLHYDPLCHGMHPGCHTGQSVSQSVSVCDLWLHEAYGILGDMPGTLSVPLPAVARPRVAGQARLAAPHRSAAVLIVRLLEQAPCTRELYG
jgi:hypothetical protein